MVEYLIVGFGLGGAAIAHHLEQRSRSFLIFDKGGQNSSRVAGGMMNPVILKRFTLAWRADEQLETAIAFYTELEDQLEQKFLAPVELYRRFSSVEEQNNWFEAADRLQLAPFLDTRLVKELSPAVSAPFSFGKVRHTYRVDTNAYLDAYSRYLGRKQWLLFEPFDHDRLEILEKGISYKGQQAQRIIFCEGFGLKENPYFNYLPLTGNKGEYIVIRSPELQLKVTVKSSVFIAPAGGDLYVVGATYNNQDKSAEPTEQARREITEKLDKLISVDYEVVGQNAGIRPSTADRRPLVGQHPEYENLYCCNGFGSRGVLTAPMAAGELLDHIENSGLISDEFDLSRFSRRYKKQS